MSACVFAFALDTLGSAGINFFCDYKEEIQKISDEYEEDDSKAEVNTGNISATNGLKKSIAFLTKAIPAALLGHSVIMIMITGIIASLGKNFVLFGLFAIVATLIAIVYSCFVKHEAKRINPKLETAITEVKKASENGIEDIETEMLISMLKKIGGESTAELKK